MMTRTFLRISSGMLLLLLGGSSLSAGSAVGSIEGPVDPLFASEGDEGLVEEDVTEEFWALNRIKRLETERIEILREISSLPKHQPRYFANHVGYHSGVMDSAMEEADDPHEILLTFECRPPEVTAIALAPALNPWAPEDAAFAFPKRFLIETKPEPEGEFEIYVDWRERDFPDPGPYPVFFDGEIKPVFQLRMTVPRDEKGAEHFFALDEIFLFKDEKTVTYGENAGAWIDRNVVASDSYTVPRVWDVKYVADGLVNLGVPLSDETVENPDLLILPEDGEELAETVEIILDLGELKRVGRVDFWPGSVDEVPALLSLGFPGKVTVELSEEGGFTEEEENELHLPPNYPEKSVRGRVVTVFGKDQVCRFVKVTFSDLPMYEGRRVLGLGEISVSRKEELVGLGCAVYGVGIPKRYQEQLGRLVDGCSQQRKILTQGEWIRGLAILRSLDRRLKKIDVELAIARSSWDRQQRRLWVYLGLGIAGLMMIGVWYQQWRRRLSLTQLRERIARDLHDDVGSNLGSITLSAERLESDVNDLHVKEDLADLSLLSREASASLRDVVWVTDKGRIRLPELVEKMEDRARRVLNDVELEFTLVSEIPDEVVPLTSKRHLMMFFKEAVHNCARHSKAKKVEIIVSVTREQLEIVVRDSGQGFDPDSVVDGWGLETMRNRASELRGTAVINSAVGQGVEIRFTVPLKSIFVNSDFGYKTSN